MSYVQALMNSVTHKTVNPHFNLIKAAGFDLYDILFLHAFKIGILIYLLNVMQFFTSSFINSELACLYFCDGRNGFSINNTEFCA